MNNSWEGCCIPEKLFLAGVRWLAVPFGGLSDKMLACAFVAGLPDTVRQLLRAGSRMDELPLAHILTRARAVLTDEVGVAAAVSAMTVGTGASVKRADTTLLCFECNQPNHLARDCLLRRKGRGESNGGRGRSAGRGGARCYRCDGLVTLRRRVRETGTGRGLQPRCPVSAAALPATNISVLVPFAFLLLTPDGHTASFMRRTAHRGRENVLT